MKILITGGSSGLGKRILEKIHLNNEVHFTYNSSIDSSKEILKKFKNTFSYKCDFNNENDIELFLKKIENIEFDVLINNYYSGKFLDRHFKKTSKFDFLEIFKNNILPVIQISQLLLEKFKIKKKGLIISISSEVVNSPPVGTSLYVVVKSVIEQLSKVWNSEYKKYGVKSFVVSPSFMRTNLTSKIDERVIELFFENDDNINEIENISNSIYNIINSHN